MGQKINTLTLRFEKFNLNNTISTIDNSIQVFYFLKLMELFFWQKKIFLTHTFLYVFNNKIFFTFFIFFRVVKINYFLGKKYKKCKIKKSKLGKIYNIQKLFKSFFFLKKNLIIFKFNNLNFYLKKKKRKVKYIFSIFKKEAFILFPRRYNFFLDFVQITVLFIENKIQINFFIKIIVEIFKILQKKRHAKFLNFISHYFNILLCENTFYFKKLKTISGIKLSIHGKLKGKMRSKTFHKVFGAVPLQTLKSNIEYARAHAFTIYGAFGIKIWVSRYNN